MDKRIIVDCDGVLLDWAYAFDVWMGEHGYKRISDTDKYYSQSLRYGITEDESYSQIKKFNESGCVGFIPAFRDSIEYVTKLSEIGCFGLMCGIYSIFCNIRNISVNILC